MNYTCPHCGLPQIVTSVAFGNFGTGTSIGRFAEAGGFEDGEYLWIEGNAVRCANHECNRVTVGVTLMAGSGNGAYPRKIPNSDFHRCRLYPASKGSPFPVGVPEPMLQDYNEAWAIIDLSPKSSATLARRCLQSMIRDFCNIRKRTLYHEIEELEAQLAADTLPKGVEPETVQAMKVLKDKGNIGAHMTEVDGKIVEVDPDEARQLLALIEMLFTDWYVGRHKRNERLKAIEALRSDPA